MNDSFFKKGRLSLRALDGPLLLFLSALLIYGLLILYSASSHHLGLIQHKLIHGLLGLSILFILAQAPPRFYQIWASYLYMACLLLLLSVLCFGDITKGAQRWLNLGIIRFQPSELAKLAVPLMVASLISYKPCPPTLRTTLYALLLILFPTLLVAWQPDLGTAILIASSGLLILFLAGLSWRLLGGLLLLAALLIPVLWFFGLQEYQRSRLVTLLNPESDPLGSGYHIIQSKIAIGSGGLWGKGWLKGTQSQLEFLPERHTDFIFSVIAEEQGLIGVMLLLALYLAVILRGLILATRAQSAFGHLVIGGYTLLFFFYVLINIGMVSGLLPVVGVPLPLISYGGSSQIILMANFGIMLSLHSHRHLLSKSI